MEPPGPRTSMVGDDNPSSLSNPGKDFQEGYYETDSNPQPPAFSARRSTIERRPRQKSSAAPPKIARVISRLTNRQARLQISRSPSAPRWPSTSDHHPLRRSSRIRPAQMGWLSAANEVLRSTLFGLTGSGVPSWNLTNDLRLRRAALNARATGTLFYKKVVLDKNYVNRTVSETVALST